MALVAHVLHVPLSELQEWEVEDLLLWADEAQRLVKRIYDAG